jgi:hypothetical protein
LRMMRQITTPSASFAAPVLVDILFKRLFISLPHYNKKRHRIFSPVAYNHCHFARLSFTK